MPSEDKTIYMDASRGSGIKLAFYNEEGEIELVQHNEEGDCDAFHWGGGQPFASIQELLCSFVVHLKSGEQVHFVVYQPEDSNDAN
jgi:hypothetical protein